MPKTDSTSARPVEGTRATDLPSTADLLASGGDGRIATDGVSGENRYGCALSPDPERLAFGSSTASTISAPGLRAAEDLRMRLDRALRAASAADVYAFELDRIRAELLRLLEIDPAAAQVVIAASGTDLLMLAAQLLATDCSRPTLAVIGEESETGGGVPAALAGRRYAARTPFADAHPDGDLVATGLTAEVVSVAARAADGAPRGGGLADLEVETLVADAVRDRRAVLLVLCDVTKTGLISPSPACALRLTQRFPGQVTVLVDACQLRLSNATLNAYLALGWMVAVTGSKFLTGPAFSGALLVPPVVAGKLRARHLAQSLSAYSASADWPTDWAAARRFEPEANFGLLLRWAAALEELRRFRAVPGGDIERFLQRMNETVAEATVAFGLTPLGRPPLHRLSPGGWDRLPTIWPVLLTAADAGRWLTVAETGRVHRLLMRDLGAQGDDGLSEVARLRVELGQPVACGVRGCVPLAALRLCASARLIAEARAEGPLGEARILEDCRRALRKTAWLASEVGAGRL
jgi:hypothetical protein